MRHGLGFYISDLPRIASLKTRSRQRSACAFRDASGPGSFVTPGQTLTGCQTCCNPRRYWLSAMPVLCSWVETVPPFCNKSRNQPTMATHGPERSAGASGGIKAASVSSVALSAICQITKYFRWLRGRPAQGFPAQNFGQHAPRENPEGARPSEKLVLTLTLTPEELRNLSFAVYCHVGEILDSDEADHPEVVPVIDRLNGISSRLIELEKGLQS